jgi:hypothetical protein
MVWIVLEIVLGTGLEGGEERGEEEDLAEAARGERGVGEAGSGNARGWWRVETIVLEF